MPGFFTRLTRRVFIALTVAVLAAVAGLALYLHQGGSLRDLAARCSGLASRADGLIDQARDVAGRAEPQVEKIESLLPALPGAGGPGPFTAAEGRIAVYFAPVEPGQRNGIDGEFLDLIESAEESIHCAFFDLEWAEAAEALVAKHEAGVDVAIVSDSEYEGREAVQACIRAGIPVVFDKRNAFMHNKFCVVDGLRVWSGSTNITSNGLFRNNNNALLIESQELAIDYTGEFQEMFRDSRFGPRSPANTLIPVLRVGEVTVECYFAPEDDVADEIVAEIKAATRQIEFMAFAFTSTDIAKAMAGRMKKGVRVRGLFEERGAGSRYSRDEYLAERGAEIHLDRNTYTMHHKVIVIDAATVVTGSYNLSQSAEKDNDENVLIVHSAEVAARYIEEFERLIAP
ncbi:MAG: phospholipase [Candidatus Hydrogenedentes bacterium]|nr:phospholipase [Candidatus Hydrogenedentota bacterium]